MAGKRGRYETNRKGKKGGILILLLLVCVLCAAVFFFLCNRQEDTETPGVTRPTEAVTEPMDLGMQAEDHYAPVLEKYRRAISEGWTKEQCEIEGISTRMEAGGDFSKAGYAFLDLDGDGREELMIAEESVPHIDNIWDIYTTLEDGTPIQLWVDECDGTQCYLYKGNIIGTDYSGKTQGDIIFHVIENKQMVLKEALSYDNDNWVHIDENAQSKSISVKEAQDISYSYEHKKLDLKWLTDIPSHFQDIDALERYTPILEKYETALAENWTLEQCEKNDISDQIFSGLAVVENLGWCLTDIDDNGRNELVISDNERVFDLYTLNDEGIPAHILTATGSDAFELCQNGVFREQVFFSKGCSWYFYQLSNGKQNLQHIVTYRNDYEGPVATERYYYGTDDNNMQQISKDEAGAYITAYQQIEFSLIPFQAGKNNEKEQVSAYNQLLALYRQALSEKWDMQLCSDNDISLMISYFVDESDRISAHMMDLDGDGVNELIITDGMMIYDLYTLKNGSPVHLITGWERNAYRLCLNNVIYNQGSNGAASSVFNYYQLLAGELVLVESVVFDANKDFDNPWFLSSDGETPEVSVTEEEANRIMDSYPYITMLGIDLLDMQ